MTRIRRPVAVSSVRASPRSRPRSLRRPCAHRRRARHRAAAGTRAAPPATTTSTTSTSTSLPVTTTTALSPTTSTSTPPATGGTGTTTGGTHRAHHELHGQPGVAGVVQRTDDDRAEVDCGRGDGRRPEHRQQALRHLRQRRPGSPGVLRLRRHAAHLHARRAGGFGVGDRDPGRDLERVRPSSPR